MNSRVFILGGGIAAVIIIIVVLIVAAQVVLSGDPGSAGETGSSFLQPQVQREARAGYVIAELYQDVHLDVASGAYDPQGRLLAENWSHDEATQTCSVDLVLAIQRGRDQAPPTATPRPTHTPLPTTPPQNPQEYEVTEHTIATDNGAGIAVAVLPVTPWPTSTARPTYTPYPTATPSPLVSSVSWIGWQGRPLAIEADGVAVLQAARDVDVFAYLSLWVGADAASQSQLARLPLPEPHRVTGSVHIRLQDSSSRFLLASNQVDAQHRSVRLKIEASPLAACDSLGLHWQKTAAVVVKALTEQPYADWRNQELPDPTPPVASTLASLTLTGLTLQPGFDPAVFEYTAAVPHTLAATTVRPVRANADDEYQVTFGGSVLSTSAPAVVSLNQGANLVTIEVDGGGATYKVTVTRAEPPP